MKNDREMQVCLLIQRFGFNSDQVKGSVILDRIEKFSENPSNRSGHSSHSSHCRHDRSGGGHANVCYSTDEILVNHEKSPSPSR